MADCDYADVGKLSTDPAVAIDCGLGWSYFAHSHCMAPSHILWTLNLNLTHTAESDLHSVVDAEDFAGAGIALVAADAIVCMIVDSVEVGNAVVAEFGVENKSPMSLTLM
jgi:hypothetical protein